MTELLAPAIRYAEDGFPVTEFIAHLWQQNVESRKAYPGVQEILHAGRRGAANG